MSEEEWAVEYEANREAIHEAHRQEAMAKAGPDVPPVDPAVLDRACDAAWKACWPEFPHRPGSTGDRHIRRALESAGPIIAAAAYRQGREDGLREASEAVGRVQMPEHQGYGTYKGHFDAGVGACRAALRSLLTDKEEA